MLECRLYDELHYIKMKREHEYTLKRQWFRKTNQ